MGNHYKVYKTLSFSLAGHGLSIWPMRVTKKVKVKRERKINGEVVQLAKIRLGSEDVRWCL